VGILIVGCVKSTTLVDDSRGEKKSAGRLFAFWAATYRIILKALPEFKSVVATIASVIICWHRAHPI
jgi:hypothetical protein